MKTQSQNWRCCRTPRQLIIELAQESLFRRVVDSIPPRIGQIVLSLPERERKLLNELTADDIQSIRPLLNDN
ncbi:hypothetical protein LCGC14_1253790 [marine sediment metagenome]|uniref:Uncharacterized protein n=1 Tax=marine sediment metagenome TaxID=412755 RepID=A0A0F9LNW6_9ZZZZ